MPRYIAPARTRLADKLRQQLDQSRPGEHPAWLRRMFRQGGFEREIDEQSLAEARALLASIDLNRYRGGAHLQTAELARAYDAILEAREALAEAEMAVVQVHWQRHDGAEPRPRVRPDDPVRLAMQRTGVKP